MEQEYASQLAVFAVAAVPGYALAIARMHQIGHRRLQFATGHGISAGAGKLGAFTGVFLFPVLQGIAGLRGILLLTAGISALGALRPRAGRVRGQSGTGIHLRQGVLNRC